MGREGPCLFEHSDDFRALERFRLIERGRAEIVVTVTGAGFLVYMISPSLDVRVLAAGSVTSSVPLRPQRSSLFSSVLGLRGSDRSQRTEHKSKHDDHQQKADLGLSDHEGKDVAWRDGARARQRYGRGSAGLHCTGADGCGAATHNRQARTSGNNSAPGVVYKG